MSELGVGASRMIAGRYELEARIGKGGIGEVWRARHLALNSLVAIKFLQGTSAQNEATRRRFTTEAQVTAQLKSRHAVQVFDFGVTDDGHPYLVMELLEGETLGRRLEREGHLGIVDTARLMGQSARALYRAHQHGIVHRDFKPDNIVIGSDDEGRDFVKVVDFGLAKLVGDLEAYPDDRTPADLSTAPPTATFTKTGAMLGTPFYMAPEQVRSASNVDLRADIWAFGVVAFECLSGTTPFTGETLAELFDAIGEGRHPLANTLEPSIPVGFNEWFDTACAPDPAQRFPDANTAWKMLLIALECSKADIEGAPTFERTMSWSGERPVVVLSDASGADGHAITVNVESKEPRRGGVESRQRKSVRKMSNASPRPASAPPPGTSEPGPLSHSISREDPPRKKRPRVMDPREETTGKYRRKPRASRVQTFAIVAPLLALAAFVGWRASTLVRRSSGYVESQAQAPRAVEAPVAVPVESAVPAPAPAPVPTAPQTASVEAESPPPVNVLPARPRPRAATAPSTLGSTRVPPVASAPTATPPRPSAIPPIDPGSYR